jgi:hypothetical protein
MREIQPPVPVFISLGRPFKPQHLTLVEHIDSALRARDLMPVRLPRIQRQGESPLAAVQALLARCGGLLVVAFPRVRSHVAYEWPDSPMQSPIAGRESPTIWLHIEAALAFQLGLPVLTLVEERLHPEGLLNPKYEEYHAVSYAIGECQEALPDTVQRAIERFADQVLQRGRANQARPWDGAEANTAASVPEVTVRVSRPAAEE